MFVWLWCGCLCEIEWNLKLFERWMGENEMTFPDFPFTFWISMNSNSFYHKTLEWRWYDFFHLKWKGFWKDLNSVWKYFKFKTLCNSMIFRREDKMTSSIIWNMSWKLKRIKLKVIWKYFENPLSIWSYLVFIQITFLQK